MRKLKKIIGTVLYIGIIAVGVWIVASVIDINAHNSITDKDFQNFAEWNMFADMGKEE